MRQRFDVIEAGVDKPEAFLVHLALELLLGHTAAHGAHGVVAGLLLTNDAIWICLLIFYFLQTLLQSF
jgi:hypothetical protein